MKTKQYTLYLENKPGELARVTKLLAESDINIDGVSVAASVDVGLVQLVTSRARETKSLLRRERIPFSEQDVCLIPIANEPGSLSRIVSRLARKNLNISYIYATGCTCKNKCRCYAVIGAGNLSIVEAACKGL